MGTISLENASKYSIAHRACMSRYIYVNTYTYTQRRYYNIKTSNTLSASERKMRVARDEFIFHITWSEQERVEISPRERVDEIALFSIRIKTCPQM